MRRKLNKYFWSVVVLLIFAALWIGPDESRNIPRVLVAKIDNLHHALEPAEVVISQSSPQKDRITVQKVGESSSSYSHQVFYQQKVDGIPVYPGGLITIDYDQNQNEIARYGVKIPATVTIANQRKLSMNEAGLRLPLEFRGFMPEQILWLESRDRPLKHAYRWSVRGHEAIVDAQSGRVLYHKNNQTE